MENLQSMRVLLIDGPGEGKTMDVDARSRVLRYLNEGEAHNFAPLQMDSVETMRGEYVVYSIGIMRGERGDQGIYSIAQRDMNTCAVERLIAGYRKPRSHHTDANVARQLVTLVGGQADGAQIAASSLQTVIHRGEEYRIVELEGKDHHVYRIGVPLAFQGSALGELIKGYRH
jgi:hypothetical protein